MLLPFQRNYLGNKRLLLDHLGQVIGERLGPDGTLWDAFAGTGGVAYCCATRSRKIILSDLLGSCTVPLDVFFRPQPEQQDRLFEKMQRRLDGFLDGHAEICHYAQENWGDKYFSMDNAMRVDFLREWIDITWPLPCWEKSYCLTVLMYAVDKVAQTYGHYDAYKDPSKWTHNRKLTLEKLDLSKTMNPNNLIYRIDANFAVRTMPGAFTCTVAFFDPPYNERDYATNYHLLENLVQWDFAPCHGKTAKIDLPKSAWTRKRQVFEQFKQLVELTHAKYIIMTYNNQPGNLLTDYQITSTLEQRGKLEVVSHDHKLITTGLADVSGNRERFFICEVNKP